MILPKFGFGSSGLYEKKKRGAPWILILLLLLVAAPILWLERDRARREQRDLTALHHPVDHEGERAPATATRSLRPR